MMEKIKLYLDQLDNGWVLQDETDTQNSSTEIVEDKDIRYQLGKAILDYMRSAMDEVASNGCEIELTVSAVPSRLIKTEQKPIKREEFISIPFGTDSELVNETITIPDGCVATIEGNKILIKKKDKSATEAIKEETVDVKPTFKAGDWVVKTNGESFCNGSKFAQIQSIELDGEMCYLDTGRWLYPSEIRLWTINDAQDGDLIYVGTEEKGIGAIFKKIDNGIIYFHCYLCADFTQGGYMPMGDVKIIYPWQKIHHQRFFQKMKEAGYEWNSKKKELIRI